MQSPEENILSNIFELINWFMKLPLLKLFKYLLVYKWSKLEDLKDCIALKHTKHSWILYKLLLFSFQLDPDLDQAKQI